MSHTLNELVIERLRAEMDRKGLTQTDLANLLNWGPSRITKLLNGRTEFSVNDLYWFCWAISSHGGRVSMVDIVRDHDYEFVAEMTPSELRLLQRIRQLPQAVRDALPIILSVEAAAASRKSRTLPAPEKKSAKAII